MRKFTLSLTPLFLILFMVSGCGPVSNPKPGPKIPPQKSSDFLPTLTADPDRSTQVSALPQTSTPETKPIENRSAKLYFGFMVHLEGWQNEVSDQAAFQRHMDAARALADVFEKYGARVTFEASPETIQASAKWENVLLELQERGHGVGVHADRGFSQKPNYDLELFTAEIREMRKDAQALGLNIQHVSGTCSELDWAKASIDAGYLFTSGGVGFCAMSMPEIMRPPEYLNCPSPSQCHGNMPLEMENRIHPWRVSTALGDWTEHVQAGALVILASDGGIKDLGESSLGPAAAQEGMSYSSEDITVLVEKIDEALRLSKAGQINQIYFSLSIGDPEVDQVFYSQMFEALKPYTESGKLEYRTLNQIYEEYVRLD